MGRPAAVLVDFDDTLVDNSVMPATVERTCESIAARVEGLEAATLYEANTAWWTKHWTQVEQQCWLGEMDLLDVSREVWRRALLDCGHNDQALVDLTVDTHQRIGREMVRLFDDAHGFLADLESSGIPVALVTNSSSSQRERLAATGIDAVFDHVVISGELGIAKPDAAIFHAALTRLGVPAPDAWHVGDSLSTDVAGARAAGLQSVWLNRTGRRAAPDSPTPSLEVTTLDGLMNQLLTWA